MVDCSLLLVACWLLVGESDALKSEALKGSMKYHYSLFTIHSLFTLSIRSPTPYTLHPTPQPMSPLDLPVRWQCSLVQLDQTC
jgi:hypothetical protein